MSIQEPFLLQSYSNSRRFQKAKALVYASHTSTTRSADGFVTVAAQGDGVHLLDVSSLHSVVSHTLGPSTTFSCPPVTQCSADGQTYSSYVGIAASSDLSQGEANQTIWAWKDNPSASTSAVQQKNSVTLPHDVYGLHALSQNLIAVSTTGSISILDPELKIRETKNASPSDYSVTHTYCFPSKEGNWSSAGLASLILVESSKSASRIRAFSVAEDHTTQDLGNCSIPLCQTVSCNPSGYLTLLCAPCSIYSYQLALSSTSSNIQISPLAPPVHLSPLSSISLLALHSSFTILCGIAQKKITLLLWDMRFSVVLASHTFDVPEGSDTTSLIASSKEHPTEAILVISSSPSSSTAKTSIFVVPLSVADSSTIAAAMGRATATAPWLKQHGESRMQFESTKKTLLSDMQTAMESRRPQSASQAFFAWEKEEKKGGAHVSYGHSFVKELLNVVLQPTKPANFPYSSDVVRRLLELGVVSASMVDAGLLNVLRIRNDWTSIRTSLKKVADLLEVDIIDCLRHVLEHETPSNAMQVDGPAADAPTLPDFLRLCVSYTCSPVALRAALRRYLPEPESLTRVLDVLDSWLGQWAGRDTSLLPPKKTLDKNAHGVYVVNLPSSNTGDGIPSIKEIASFIQAILDSSLLVILQHAPAHHVLRRISRKVETEIRVVDETEKLRGPLEAFVKAQGNTLKLSEQGKEQLADWRQRSKLVHDQTAGAIMVYQVEHLVL